MKTCPVTGKKLCLCGVKKTINDWRTWALGVLASVAAGVAYLTDLLQ